MTTRDVAAAAARREVRRNEPCPRCGDPGATLQVTILEGESGRVNGAGTIEIAWCKNRCHRNERV
jgi:hypothetical protein